jgi:hypothetical protein
MMVMKSLRVDGPASYGLQSLLHIPTLIQGISVDVDLLVSISWISAQILILT